MTRYSVAVVCAGAALAASPLAAATHHPKAKLTMAQARLIALRAAHGKVVDAEYEKEAGAWRYSFDIRQGRRIHEIGVDANTGRIVEDKFEGVHDKD